MLHRFIAIIISFVACITVCAQERCIINGTIADNKLENGKKIKKVYLTYTNANGENIKMATAKIKNGKYTINYDIAQNEPVMLYNITGFDNDKNIELFIEPGEIFVNTEKATEPHESKITGTPTNNLYTEYRELLKGYDETKPAEVIKKESERIRFLIEHNNSPMAPLEMERSVMPYLSNAYAEQMVKCIFMDLHNHPYYISFRNAMLTRCLKVGNESPNIDLTLPCGTKKQLNDYRGKYVLLDFWESTNGCSTDRQNTLNELYELTKEKADLFNIISLSLDKDINNWKKYTKNNGTDQKGWIQAYDSTGKSINSFKVEKAPHMILIDPEGRAISLDMQYDEVVEKVGLILSGDLYYLDQE